MKFGDLVIATLPFTDGSGEKVRPGVVVSNETYHRVHPDVVLMPLTRQVQKLPPHALLVADPVGSGLGEPSAIRPVFFSVEVDLVRKYIGHLDPETEAGLRTLLGEILG